VQLQLTEQKQDSSWVNYSNKLLVYFFVICGSGIRNYYWTEIRGGFLLRCTNKAWWIFQYVPRCL